MIVFLLVVIIFIMLFGGAALGNVIMIFLGCLAAVGVVLWLGSSLWTVLLWLAGIVGVFFAIAAVIDARAARRLRREIEASKEAIREASKPRAGENAEKRSKKVWTYQIDP